MNSAGPRLPNGIVVAKTPGVHSALPFLVVAIAVPLAACSSATVAEVNGCTEGTPLAMSVSQSGALNVAVCTSSQPPVQDQMVGEIMVTNASGKPVDGLTLSVTPWMPEMGHGQSPVVTVTPKGKGVYSIAPLAFFMAGEWELVTKIDGQTTSDSANPSFYVP
jgi:hypothetical protein